jgi:hypothetical protein
MASIRKLRRALPTLIAFVERNSLLLIKVHDACTTYSMTFVVVASDITSLFMYGLSHR